MNHLLPPLKAYTLGFKSIEFQDLSASFSRTIIQILEKNYLESSSLQFCNSNLWTDFNGRETSRAKWLKNVKALEKCPNTSLALPY